MNICRDRKFSASTENRNKKILLNLKKHDYDIEKLPTGRQASQQKKTKKAGNATDISRQT